MNTTPETGCSHSWKSGTTLSRAVLEEAGLTTLSRSGGGESLGEQVLRAQKILRFTDCTLTDCRWRRLIESCIAQKETDLLLTDCDFTGDQRKGRST